jgi:NADP-dependent 3-hydroxy acid dehydrogenase YdfG/tetratricopeptide (TPR) repeat protein
MATKKLALAYSIDNLPVAEALANALGQSNYAIEHFYCKKNTDELPLADRLHDYDGAIILLVSDNFLRSLQCMNRALQLAQQKAGQLIPVVIDGQIRNEKTGTYEVIHTRFERIGDIIPYINFWQNQYLEIRSQKRKGEGEDEQDKESVNEHLRILRQVSSDASEFLRVLRNMTHYQYSDFIENHFQLLFQHLGDEKSWQDFKAKQPFLNLNIPTESVAEAPVSEPIILPAVDEKASLTAEPDPEPEPKAEPGAPSEAIEIPSIEPVIEALDFENIAETISDFSQQVELGDDTNENSDTPEGESSETEIGNAAPQDSNPIVPDPTPIEEVDPDEFPGDNPLMVDENGDLIESEQRDWEAEPLEPAPLAAPNPAANVAPSWDQDDETEFDDEDEDPNERVMEILSQTRSMISAGQVDEGIQFIKQGIKDYPNNPDLHYFLALVLAQNTRDLYGAVEQLQLALEMDASHEASLFLLGELAEHKGDLDSALECFEKLAEINPDYPDIFYRIAQLVQQQHPEEAERAALNYRKAAKRNPQLADAHYQYANLLAEKLQDPQKAERYFLKTLDIQPRHPFANYDLALLTYQSGNLAQAALFYQAAIQLNPELQTPENDQAFLQTTLEEEQALASAEPETTPEPATVSEPSPELAATLGGGAMEPEMGTEPVETAADTVLMEPSAAEIAPSEMHEAIELESKTEEGPSGEGTPVLGTETELPRPEELIEEPETPETDHDGYAQTIENTETLAMSEHDTIEALKINIKRLEELLLARSAKAAEAAAAVEPEALKVAKTAFITGGSSGIGLACAQRFAAAGWRLILNARGTERLEAAAQAIREKYGVEVYTLAFDVRDRERINDLIASLPDEWSHIDLLLNNAGKAKGFDEIQEGSIEHWEEMIDTNIKGLLYLTRAITPLMVNQHSGHVINLGSIAGKEVYPKGNVYCASKAAVDALTYSMRLDLYKYNIRVSQVAPGHVEETEFALVRFDGDADRAQIYQDFQPLRSSDVAETVFFIANQPSHVNIQDVVMYGTQQANATLIDRSGRA